MLPVRAESLWVRQRQHSMRTSGSENQNNLSIKYKGRAVSGTVSGCIMNIFARSG
jgi:hypothetical protein